MQLFSSLASELNMAFKLPRDLIIEHRSCDAVNAFYESDTGSIWLCYELLSSVADLASDRHNLPAAEVTERVRGTWMFIFFHELGHALIDYYDIPIAGSEEHAVDNFSTLSLLASDGAKTALLAASYWGASDSRIYTELDYADQHALNAQRFYSILCLVYGSDPGAHADIVDDGTLTSERAAQCPEEYERVRESWQRLLGEWVDWDELGAR